MSSNVALPNEINHTMGRNSPSEHHKENEDTGDSPFQRPFVDLENNNRHNFNSNSDDENKSRAATQDCASLEDWIQSAPQGYSFESFWVVIALLILPVLAAIGLGYISASLSAFLPSSLSSLGNLALKEMAVLRVISVLEWIQSSGSAAPLIFIALHASCVVFCFPGTVLFELGAGLLFGQGWGILCVMASKAIGASLSFWLGRTLIRSWVEQRVKRYPRFAVVYQMVGQEQWKWTFLLRLSPVPSWVNNYGLALTPVGFVPFLVSTVIGGALTIVQSVNIGVALGSIAALVSGGLGTTDSSKPSEASYMQGVMMLAGIATTLVLTAKIRKLTSGKLSVLDDPKSQ